MRGLYQTLHDVDGIFESAGLKYFVTAKTLSVFIQNKVFPKTTDHGDMGIDAKDLPSLYDLRDTFRRRGYGMTDIWWPAPWREGPKMVKIFALEGGQLPAGGRKKAVPYVEVFLYDFAHPIPCADLYAEGSAGPLPEFCVRHFGMERRWNMKTLAWTMDTKKGDKTVYDGTTGAVSEEAWKNRKRYGSVVVCLGREA